MMTMKKTKKPITKNWFFTGLVISAFILLPLSFLSEKIDRVGTPFIMLVAISFIVWHNIKEFDFVKAWGKKK